MIDKERCAASTCQWWIFVDQVADGMDGSCSSSASHRSVEMKQKHET